MLIHFNISENHLTLKGLKEFNPHLPSGSVHPYQLDESISNFRGVWCIFVIFISFQIDIPVSNSEDPDQTPHSAVSELGLHCLPMSQKWEARLIWVNGVHFMYLFQLDQKKEKDKLLEHQDSTSTEKDRRLEVPQQQQQKVEEPQHTRHSQEPPPSRVEPEVQSPHKTDVPPPESSRLPPQEE